MDEQFPGVSGYEGILTIGNEEWPATRWVLVAETEQVPIATVASCPFPDVLHGWTTATVVATGSGRRGFNPYLSNRQMYQGSYHHVILATHLGNVYDFPSALVVKWEWSTAADGQPFWICSMVANWKFTDWNGDVAA